MRARCQSSFALPPAIILLFVAMDLVGALPLILARMGHLPLAERNRQFRDGLLTALALELIFARASRRLGGHE